MQIVINVPFQRYLLIGIFISLVIKVGYCTAMMIAGDSMQTLETTLLLVRHFIDTAMWFMIAVWFLHLYLYNADLVSRRSMHLSTNFTLVTAMFKFFSTVVFAIYYIKYDGWMIFYSIIELIIWISILCYLCYLWRCYLNEYRQMNKHSKKSNKYFTLFDELERRYTIDN